MDGSPAGLDTASNTGVIIHGRCQMTSRIKKYSTGFTQVPNELLNEAGLSLTAKGLYAFMASKPVDWNFTLKSMSKQLKEGMTAISSALNDLKDYGWIMYEKHHDGSGTYHLFSKPNLENPNLENPNLEIPNLGKPKRISNKDSIERNIDSNKDCSFPELANAVQPKQNEPAPSTQVFNAYVLAMKKRYGQQITPARNAKVNGILCNMIERIGLDGSILVASNYPFHNNSWYVQKVHSVDFMLQDCEALLIQCQSGQMITKTGAYQADKSGHFQNQIQQANSQYDSREAF